jgi:hypothetical protein
MINREGLGKMMNKEKERGKREDIKCQPKKPYKTPQLIVHGTLEVITMAKLVGQTDGAGFKSH